MYLACNENSGGCRHELVANADGTFGTTIDGIEYIARVRGATLVELVPAGRVHVGVVLGD